ncbi:LysE family translocator [Streptomyces alanosinicus]|uniref:Lysine transporter LysE n=1 Tax=Streptomyces alanosinicus TaxID=68171 RepID=A0A918YEI1_9ACTN|nr:LysE family translocator [Streptomyces alanosinicus]GHE00392.1 lysine transporter LysE [Streptomyces alanosinicus]
MDSGLLFSFLAVDLLLVCVPGADWAYVIATALRGRSVPRAVAGLVSGYALHTVLATAGLAVLVAGSPKLLTALTVAGAGYLLWLGWSVLRRPAIPGPDEAATQSGRSGHSGRSGRSGEGRLFLRGATISGLNPKGLLLYLSVLPQFLTLHGPHLPVPAQTAALGLLHMACCAAVYLTVGVLARALLSARPAAARAVTRTSGAAMLGIGAVLLAERLATL